MAAPSRLLALSIAGALLGVAVGLAVGIGSLWWFAVLLAIPLVIAASGARTRPLPSALAALATVTMAAILGGATYPDSISGAVNAAVVAAPALAFCAGGIAWRVARRGERDELARAQELAIALEEQQEGAVREALLRDRIDLAGEIHDRLGHRLNHSIVTVASLGQGAEPGSRHAGELSMMREELASVLDEIGRIVVLLDEGERVAALRLDVVDIVADARERGAVLDPDLDLEALRRLPEGVRQVLGAFAAEALGNSQRHAPGERVHIGGAIGAQAVEVQVTNAVNDEPGASRGAGTGLRRMQERVSAAGGTLVVDAGDPFRLAVRVPVPGEVLG